MSTPSLTPTPGTVGPPPLDPPSVGTMSSGTARMDATSPDTTLADPTLEDAPSMDATLAETHMDPALAQVLPGKAPEPTQTPTKTNNASDDLGGTSTPLRTSPPSPTSFLSSLGQQHRHYVHSAASYLAGIPGGPLWEKLLERYILFEGLSSARSVSTIY